MYSESIKVDCVYKLCYNTKMESNTRQPEESEILHAPDHNEPGLFTAPEWFTSAIDDAREVYDRVDKQNLLPVLRDHAKSLKTYFALKEVPLQRSPGVIIQRYWRNIGILSAAARNCPTNKVDYDLVGELVEPRAVYDLYGTTYSTPIYYSIFRTRYPSDPVRKQTQYRSTVVNEFLGKLERTVDNSDTSQDKYDKKIRKDISAVTRRMANETPGELASLTKQRLTAPEKTSPLPYYKRYLSHAVTLYNLALLSGNKDIYEVVAAKMEKAARVDVKLHGMISVKSSDRFADEIIDAFNEDPSELNGILNKHLERGVAMPEAFFITSRLLTDLADSLRKLKPYSQELAHIESSRIVDVYKNNVLLQALGNQAPEQETNQPDLVTKLEPTQLDWEILPPGELEDYARAIVDDIAQRKDKPVEIDLERLNMLDMVRTAWGVDRSYYARGRLNSNKKYDQSSESIDADEYILLVLQDLDDNNNVTAEHAIAESPIVGPHAAYVYRQDTSPERHSWRTIMSLTKQQARMHGARAVKHTLSQQSQMSLTEQMAAKVQLLLDCDVEEFKNTRFFNSKGISYLGRCAIDVDPA